MVRGESETTRKSKERMMQTHHLVLKKPQWFAFLGSTSIMDTIAGSIEHKYNMMRLEAQVLKQSR